MRLTPETKKCIEKKILVVEAKYNITALFWCVRGSMHAGIYRKNSDLDILYIFKKNESKEINAIHDIVGYGFDLWGWNIEHVLITVQQNLKQILLGNTVYWVFSEEHSRGNLLYFGGIYCSFGNQNYFRLEKEWEHFERILWKTFEPRILQMEFKADFFKIKKNIVSGVPTTFCDYLNVIYELLLLEHVLRDGLPGETDIYLLEKLYLPDRYQDTLNYLLLQYRNAIGKYEQRAYISNLNDFILKQVDRWTDISLVSIKESANVKQSMLEIELLYTYIERRHI